MTEYDVNTIIGEVFKLGQSIAEDHHIDSFEDFREGYEQTEEYTNQILPYIQKLSNLDNFKSNKSHFQKFINIFWEGVRSK